MMDDNAGDFEADCSRKRNLDRRRETSRYAARDRRGKEADIFTDLKEVVPIVEEATVTHVDRIALLRVASTMFRLRKHASKLLKTNLCEESSGLWAEATLLESLDGFVAIIDSDGVILYVTESVSIYLGLTQTDLTGRSLKEFVHPNDYEEFSKLGADTADDGYMTVMRMKSVISPRGRNLNLKSALFKPVNCRLRAITDEGGRLRVLQCSTQPAGQGSSAAAAAKNAEILNGTYMTRHTCDMKFSYVSESFNYILRHEARSLMGTSFYNLVHPADINAVASSMREMLLKGHTRTPYYRLIGAGKTVVWVQTEATTVNHTSKGHKGQYVICVHDLLGTQSELESFIVGRDSCHPAPAISVHVKKELDDSPDSRKSSYEEVLQWLFRDHPNSPAPNATLFRTQDHILQKRRPITGTCSDDPDPPLATAALFASRIDSPESSVDDVTYDNSSTSPYTNNAGVEYSPLAAGVAECELRSSGGSRSSAGGGAGAGGGVGGTGCGTEAEGGGTRTHVARGTDTIECIQHATGLHDFAADLPADALLNTVRISAVPSTDAYALSNADTLSGGASERSHMYSTVSTASAQYTRPLAYDPYLSASATLGQANHTHCATTQLITPAVVPYKETTEDLFESPDLQMLAPFVAHEDMMQLTTDIHGLLPDLNFADWIPADPAPNSEQQRSCNPSGDSPTLSPPTSNPSHTPQNTLNGCVSSSTTLRKSSTPISRHNSGSRSFRPIHYPAPSTSPAPKPTSTAYHSFSNSGISAGTVSKLAISTAGLVSRSHSETSDSTDVISSQWMRHQQQQQNHRSLSMQTNVLGGGCTWTEIGVRGAQQQPMPTQTKAKAGKSDENLSKLNLGHSVTISAASNMHLPHGKSKSHRIRASLTGGNAVRSHSVVEAHERNNANGTNANAGKDGIKHSSFSSSSKNWGQHKKSKARLRKAHRTVSCTDAVLNNANADEAEQDPSSIIQSVTELIVKLQGQDLDGHNGEVGEDAIVPSSSSAPSHASIPSSSNAPSHVTSGMDKDESEDDSNDSYYHLFSGKSFLIGETLLSQSRLPNRFK